MNNDFTTRPIDQSPFSTDHPSPQKKTKRLSKTRLIAEILTRSYSRENHDPLKSTASIVNTFSQHLVDPTIKATLEEFVLALKQLRKPHNTYFADKLEKLPIGKRFFVPNPLQKNSILIIQAKEHEILERKTIQLTSFDGEQLASLGELNTQMRERLVENLSKGISKEAIPLEVTSQFILHLIKEAQVQKNWDDLLELLAKEFDQFKTESRFCSWLRNVLAVVLEEGGPEVQDKIEALAKKIELEEITQQTLEQTHHSASAPPCLKIIGYRPFATALTTTDPVPLQQIDIDLHQARPAQLPSFHSTKAIPICQLWENYFQTLRARGKFELLDTELNLFVSQLPQAPLIIGWITTLSLEEKQLFSTLLACLVKEIVSTHFCLRLHAPPSLAVVNLLKLFEIQENIICSIPEANYGFEKHKHRFTFPHMKSLTGPYLDLGGESHEYDSITQRSSIPPSRALASGAQRNTPYGEAVKRNRADDSPKTAADERNLQSGLTIVGDVRESLLYLQILLNPYLFLCDHPRELALRQESVFSLNGDEGGMMGIHPQEFYKNQASVIQKLSLNQKPLTFSYADNQIVLDPVGIKVSATNFRQSLAKLYEWSHTIGFAPDSNIDPENPIVSHRMRQAIVDSCVTCKDSENVSRAVFLGENLSPYTLVNDGRELPHLDIDSSRELKFSQTDSTDRVKNTFINVSKYSHLLEQAETKHDWSVAFNLNLFAFGNLARLLKEDPAYAPQMVWLLKKFTEKYRSNPVQIGHFYFSWMAKIVTTLQKAAAKNEILKLPAQELEQVFFREFKKLQSQLLRPTQSPQRSQVKNYLLGLMALNDHEKIGEDELINRLKLTFTYLHHAEQLFTKREKASFLQCHHRLVAECSKRDLLRMRLHDIVSLPKKHEPWDSIEKAPFVFKKQNYRVDILHSIVEAPENLQNPRVLPEKTRLLLANLVDPATLKNSHPVKLVTIADQPYFQFKFQTISNEEVTVYVSSNQEGVYFIQKAFGNPPQQYQIQTECLTEPLSLPESLKGLQLWISQDKKTALFVNSTGEVTYKATLSLSSDDQINIQKLTQLSLKAPPQVILQAHIPINSLRDAKDWLVLGTNHVAQYLYDTFYQLGYQWDSGTKQWLSERFKGYSLDPNAYYLMHFKRSFLHYQVLKCPGKNPLILLSPMEYRVSSLTNSPLSSNAQVVSIPESALEEPIVLELDADKGLKANHAKDYLYLAYVYQIQDKYQEAARALTEASHRLQQLDSHTQTIFGWIKNAACRTPNGKAFLQKVYLTEATILQMQGQAVEIPLDQLQTITEKVSNSLNLSKGEMEMLRFLRARAILPLLELKQQALASEEFKQLTTEELTALDILLLEGRCESSFIAKALPKRSESFVKSIHQTAQSLNTQRMLFSSLTIIATCNLSQDAQKEILKGGLDAEIAIRKARIQRRQTDSLELDLPIERCCTPVFWDTPSSCDLNSYIYPNLDQNLPTLDGTKIDQALAAYERLAQNKNGAALALANTIIQDARTCKATTQTKTLNKAADFIRLRADRHALFLAHSRLYDERKSEILKLFDHGIKTESDLMQQLKEHFATGDELFQQVKYTFARGDWSEFIQQGLLTSDKIPELEELILSYLINKTASQLAWKQMTQIDKWEASGRNPEEGVKLQHLLTIQRQYDPNTYPYTKMALVVEEALKSKEGPGIIINAKQIKHFEDMLTHKSAFKHEVWGGGKTTLLRNLIAAYHAQKGFLAGLFTDAALFNEHHHLLKETTADVFGTRAVALDYGMKTSLDPLALRLEFLKLLRVTEEKGRIDQTLHDFVILGHLETASLLKMSTDHPESLDTAQQLGNIHSFFEDNLICGSDEVDQLTNPRYFHNMASQSLDNSKTILPKSAYLAGLGLLKMIQSEPIKSQWNALKKNHPKDISLKQRQQLLYSLANVFFEWELSETTLNKTQTLHYLLNEKRNNQSNLAFYEKKIKLLPQKIRERIQWTYLLLNGGLPLSDQKMCGVNYKRSKDGIHTKPATAGVVSEKSEFSSIATVIGHTIFDYFRNGVSVKTIPQYLLMIKKISNEPGVKENFRRFFGIDLKAVTPSDYGKIALAISKSPPMLNHYLRQLNFSTYKYCPKIIQGSAATASYMLKEFWGSSGNTENAAALPTKIAKLETLQHQSGTLGMVLINLLKDIKEDPKFIIYDRMGKVPPGTLIAKKLSQEGLFVDIAPFFEGKSSKSIVRDLAKECPQDTFCFPNSQGGYTHYKHGVPAKKEDPSNAKNPSLKTVLSKDKARGIDRDLAPLSRHVAALGSNNNSIEVTQGLLRARGWGQGQSYDYILDTTLREKLTNQKYQDVPYAVRLMDVFAENTAANLERLYYMQACNEIDAMARLGAKRVLRSLKEASKIQLRDLMIENDWLEQDAMPSLDELASPKLPQTRLQKIEQLVKGHQDKLRVLVNSVLKSSIDNSEKHLILADLTQIEKQIAEFMQGLRIEFLTESVSQEDEHDGIAETEMVQEQENVSEVEGETELTAEAENSMANETTSEKDVFGNRQIVRDTPPSEEMMKGLFDKFLTEPLLSSPVKEPHIYLLGDSPKPTYYYTWAYLPEKPKNHRYARSSPVLLAPSVLICYDKKTQGVGFAMGHSKYADTIFENRDYVPKNSVHYKLHSQIPLHLAMPKVPPESMALIKQQVAFAKLYYLGEVEINEEEKAFLTKWYNSQNIFEQSQLIDLTEKHLTQNFPLNVKNNPILKLFKELFSINKRPPNSR